MKFAILIYHLPSERSILGTSMYTYFLYMFHTCSSKLCVIICFFYVKHEWENWDYNLVRVSKIVLPIVIYPCSSFTSGAIIRKALKTKHAFHEDKF